MEDLLAPEGKGREKRSKRGNVAFLYTFKGTNPILELCFVISLFSRGFHSKTFILIQNKTAGYTDPFNRTGRTWSSSGEQHELRL